MVNNPCKCKKCGYTPLVFTIKNNDNVYNAQCIRCNIYGPKCTSPFAAITAWNEMHKTK